MYTQKVMEHFKEPHNYGKIENPSGVGKVGNIVCGDVMRLYIKVEEGVDGKERIVDIKYETYGCVAAIATSSVMTDMVMGRTIEEAMKIGKNEIVEALGGLPPIKVHCSLMASDALGEAIYDYLKKKGEDVPEKLEKRHERVKKEIADINGDGKRERERERERRDMKVHER